MDATSVSWLLLSLFFSSSSASIEKVNGSNLITSSMNGGGSYEVIQMELSPRVTDERISNTILWTDVFGELQHLPSDGDLSFKFESSHSVSIERRRRATADELLCRAPDGHYLPIDLFALDTCARCYRYIPDNPSFFHRNSKWNHTVVTVRTEPLGISFNVTHLIHHRENVTVTADVGDDENKLRLSFTSFKAEEKWKSCCKAAVDCCQRMLRPNEPSNAENDQSTALSDLTSQQEYTPSSQTNLTSTSIFCPPTWDGWTCWQRTVPNRVALAPCPHYIYFETEPPACTRYAEKACMEDGLWYRRGDGGLASEKTNYIPCSPVGMLKHRTNVHVFAYAISTAALFPALFVFYSYRQLNVYRIRLHKNMFISILLNSMLVIVFKVFAILPQLMTPPIKDSFVKQNAPMCRLIMITLKYLRLTNYMWMFCEGFYLHRLIAAAFAEQNSFAIFYFIGWVFPLVPTGIYALVRAIWYDTRCWIEPIEAWEWVLNAPCLFSLVVNMIFLINIIRILVMKLRSAHSNEPSQYRKAVRATLVLVPLFGLHFVVTIYRPSKGGCEWIEFYHYVNALLDGLQGCLVAIIFCYGNGEVHYLIKRSYRRFREEHCLRSSRNSRGRANCGGLDGVGGPGGIGCSIFLGRSNGSTTHFSLADVSPNPQQKQISMTIMPALGDRTSIVIRQLNSMEQIPQTIGLSQEAYPEFVSSSDNRSATSNLRTPVIKEPLIGDSCVDRDGN